MSPIFLYLHILFGGLSLILGAIAIGAKKGGKIHVLSGKYYAISMLFACFFSLFVSIPKGNYFLICIAFFSYYGVYMGQRYIYLKKLNHKSWKETLGVYFGLITSLGMLFTAAYFFINGYPIQGIILSVFGLLFIWGVIEDYRKIINRDNYTYSKEWLEMHIKRMGGGYIATLTAFIVVNNHQYVPDLVGWLGPGLIGGFFIGKAIKKIKQS